MNLVQPIGIVGMCLGLFLSITTIFLMRWVKLPLTKDIIVGTLRTFLQLILVGFFLEYIFAVNQWYWVIGFLIVMILVAAHTAEQRLKKYKRLSFLPDISFSILLGSAFTLFWATQVVIHVHPWYHPQYVIPLAGMVIGNSMNSAALALDRFYGEVSQLKPEIETLLALGATGQQAAESPLKNALMAAMIPNINALMVVGIVSLPGMMTGQILAGESPLNAVLYQIIVMLMITCASAITSVLSVKMSVKKIFNSAEQLILEH